MSGRSATAPLAAQTRRTYVSKVRQYLAWLASAQTDGDPLDTRDGRDWAVRDYRTHLQAGPQTPPRDDQQRARRDRRPLHPPPPRSSQRRPARAPGNGTARPQPARPAALPASRPSQPLAARPSPRAHPVYAGARISEIVGLDVDDVRLSARKGTLPIYGKGERVRDIPIHPQLRTALAGWLDERPGWPGAQITPALSLNQRGQRLSAKGAHDVSTGLAAAAGLDDDATTHVLRHTFATTLVRGGTDLVIVAELLGHWKPLAATPAPAQKTAHARLTSSSSTSDPRSSRSAAADGLFGLILAGPLVAVEVEVPSHVRRQACDVGVEHGVPGRA